MAKQTRPLEGYAAARLKALLVALTSAGRESSDADCQAIANSARALMGMIGRDATYDHVPAKLRPRLDTALAWQPRSAAKAESAK